MEQDHMDQADPERVYTIEQLYRDLGISDEPAKAKSPESTLATSTPASQQGFMAPPAWGSPELIEVMYEAHVSMLMEIARVSDRCGPEPYRQSACITCLCDMSDDLRDNTAHLFADEYAHRPLTGMISQCLHNAAREVYIIGARIEQHEELLLDDDECLRAGYYCDAVMIRAGAEVMRSLHHRRMSETNSARREAIRWTALRLYSEIAKSVGSLDYAERENIIEYRENAVHDAWEECSTIRRQEIHDHNHRIARTLASTTITELSAPQSRNLDTANIDPTEVRAGLIVRKTKAPGLQLIPGRPQIVPYLIFSHNLILYIQAVGDPVPDDVPESRYRDMLKAAHDRMGQTNERHSRVEEAKGKINDALGDVAAGIGKTGLAERRSMAEWFTRSGMPPGAVNDLVSHTLEEHPEAARRLIADLDLKPRQAKRRAGRQIISAARGAGLDEHQLALMAQAMGWQDPTRLGVRQYRPTRREIVNSITTANAAGIPTNLLTRMRNKLEEWGARG